MAKYNDYDTSGEEIFLRPSSAESKAGPLPLQPDIKPAAEEETSGSAATAPAAGAANGEQTLNINKNKSFEASVNSFSSKDTVKGKRKKKRSLGVNGFVRMVAVCVCVGIFAFSLFKIAQRMVDLSAAEKAYESLNDLDGNSLVSHPKPVRHVPSSLDLLSYLGSGYSGIELLDPNTQNYYDTLRETVLNIQKDYPECIGYITVSGTKISYPLMKTSNNDYYLRHLYNGEYSRAGSIFADYRLSDNFDENMNTVIYGHCMTNGTMFRGIKLFFDDVYRYSRAQDIEITIVTADGVYIYEYFSGYRSEGSNFISMFRDDGQNLYYYNFLKNIRALNTIPKNVGYNANSRIVTLITCTNLASKPDERYVLHGILKNHFTF